MNNDKQNNFKNSPIFGGGIDWDWERIASLAIAGAYVVLGLIGSSSGSVREMLGVGLGTSIALIVPLACIWFSDEMGDSTGSFFSTTKISPGIFIRIGGWVLLFLPVIRGVIIWWIDSGLRRE